MITTEIAPLALPSLDELSTEEFLMVVGQRVRQQRARKSMSRKRLAEVSSVSERYLAQLESGQGNMSIALLRKVTSAIGISLGDLMSEEVTEACARKTSLAIGTGTGTGTGADHPVTGARKPDCANHVGTARESSEHGLRQGLSGESVRTSSPVRDLAALKIAEV